MPRTRKPSDSGGYEVGYGRPPRHSRFKPGQSGNPRGRPKGRKNLATILEETLYRPVPITESGRRRTVPAIEAMLLSMLRQSLDGNLRAFDKLAKLLPMLHAASAATESGPEESPAFDPEHDARLLAEFAEMIREAESMGAGKARPPKKEKNK